jgi:predicted MFS family arabinose efflux permease
VSALPRFPPAVAAVAVTVVGMLPVYLVGGLAVQVRADLGVGRSGLGALVAAFFGGAAVGSLLGGRSADRLGAPRVMRVAAAVGAVALLAAAVAPRTLLLAVALVLGGLASGVGQPASNALIAKAVAPHRRGTAYGAKQAAIPAGVLLGGLAVPVFGVTVGWRWAFVAAAVAALAVPVLVPPTTPAAPERVETGRRSSASRAADAAGPYRFPPLAVLAVGTTLGAGVGNSFGAFFVESAVAAGQAPATAGLLAAGGSALGVLSRLGLGMLADRRDGRWFLVVAAMMLAGAPASALMALGAPATVLPAVVLAYGIGWAWAGLLNHAVTLLHPDAPGRATGVTQSGVAIGGALGPLGFGALADTVSLTAAWSVTAVLAALAAVAVVAGRRLLLRDRPALTAALRRPAG